MGLAASSQVDSQLAPLSKLANLPFLALIKLYRAALSPFLGGQCRFEPTCSRYAAEAYRLHGPISGTRMTLTRICRCHPWNKGGFDPVQIPDHNQHTVQQHSQDGNDPTQEGNDHGATTSSTKA